MNFCGSSTRLTAVLTTWTHLNSLWWSMPRQFTTGAMRAKSIVMAGIPAV